jgi:hypothetical protein
MRPFEALIPALGFASPWLLLGLGLAAVPIIIHLLFRRPYREVRWAATRFLLAAVKKHSKQLRLEQLLLLLVRVAVVLLVAFALARPYLGSPRAVAGPDPPRHRIIVLDASYSMGHELAGQTSFELAKQAIREVLDAARPGDAFHVVRMSDLGPRVVVGRTAYQATQVAETVDDLELSFGTADPLATLGEIPALLKHAPELRHKEVMIFSDFQRADWRPAGERGEQLRTLLDELGKQATVRLFDAGRTPATNPAVASLEVEGTLVKTGAATRLTAAIRADGETERQRERVELRVDDRLVATETVEVKPNENATVAFSHVFVDAGPHGVEVRLPPDALAADNARFLSVTARDRLRVLLVNGRPAGRAEETATFYVKNALAPASVTASSHSDFEPTVIDDGKLADEPLAVYDAVVLSNVGLVTDREADRLRSFAAAGGGVVLALGDNVRPEAYNRLLADAKDKALLPVRLVERVGNPARPEDAMRFDASNLTHPIVSPFAGNPGTGLDTDFTLAYAKAVLAENAAADVPLRFENGDPAIVTASLGAGRVVLLTTSVDTTWGGPWPQTGRSFLPLVHEIVRFSATGRPAGRSATVGDPLTWDLTERVAGLTAAVKGPGDFVANVPATVDAAGLHVAFEATDRPGLYSVELAAPIDQSQIFAVNVNAEEGDLTALSEQERMALVSGAKPLIAGSNAAASATASPEWKISRWLLAAAFGLLLVEQVLAWRFAWGVFALAVVACALMFRWAWLVDPYYGTAVAGVSLIGLVVWAERLRRR